MLCECLDVRQKNMCCIKKRGKRTLYRILKENYKYLQFNCYIIRCLIYDFPREKLNAKKNITISIFFELFIKFNT